MVVLFHGDGDQQQRAWFDVDVDGSVSSGGGGSVLIFLAVNFSVFTN